MRFHVTRKIALFCTAGTLLATISWLARAARGSGQGTVSQAIRVDGLTRTYLLHVPPDYESAKPVPIVLVLHGATQSPASAERMSGMSTLADKEGFLVVYPRGTGRLPTWNAGNCCGSALQDKIDDVNFTRALIAKIESEYSVDPKRIFVTGISNGAMMSYRLGCELSDKVAAIAPVEGAQDLACQPSQPVSIIVFHGTADRLVPFNGGTTPFQIGPRRIDTPVADTVSFWVRRDACSPTPERQDSPEVRTSIYSGCRDGTGVALYAIQGGRHMWPGLPISGNSVPATDLMWAFFMDHPKP